jgi:hypothetical protein
MRLIKYLSVIALAAIASPASAHEIENLTGTLAGEIIGNMDLGEGNPTQNRVFRPEPRPIGLGSNVETGGFNPQLVQAVGRGSIGALVVGYYNGRPIGEVHMVNGHPTYMPYTGNSQRRMDDRIGDGDTFHYEDGKLARVVGNPSRVERPQARPNDNDRPRRSARPVANPDRYDAPNNRRDRATSDRRGGGRERGNGRNSRGRWD